MADTRISGGNIAGCERIRVVTLEEAPRAYVIETATSLSFAASLSAGEERNCASRTRFTARCAPRTS
jgi:hypothetical protein